MFKFRCSLLYHPFLFIKTYIISLYYNSINNRSLLQKRHHCQLVNPRHCRFSSQLAKIVIVVTSIITADLSSGGDTCYRHLNMSWSLYHHCQPVRANADVASITVGPVLAPMIISIVSLMVSTINITVIQRMIWRYVMSIISEHHRFGV